MKKPRVRGTPTALNRKAARQSQAGEAAGAPMAAEPGLRKASGLWEATFDAITDPISIIDRDFRIVRVNKAFAQALKKTPQELLGRKCYETVHSSAEPWGTCPHRQALQSGKSVTEEFWEPHLERYLQVSVTPLLDEESEMNGSVHIIRDITERRDAEEALRRSEEAALRLAQDTGVIAEIGRIISSSLDVEEVYERFAEEVRKLIPFDRILVNLANRQEGTLTTAYIAGMEVAGTKKGVVFPLGETVTEEMMRTGTPALFLPDSIEEVRSRFPGLILAFQAGLRSRLSVLLIARGEVIGSLALWSKQPKAYGERDIRLAESVASQVAGAIANAQLFRERKQAEEALRESEESYRSLVETSPDAILLHEEGRFVYLNPAAVRLYGADSPEELYGKNAFDIVHPDDREAIRNRTDFIVATGTPVPLKEIRIVRRDGSTVDVEATAGISCYRGNKVVQVIQRDITDRKLVEEKIRASLREKEVLLKEIHHRVKNNLQIISSLLYLQSTRTEHAGAVSALRESRNRIKSMALIHERLYSSPDLASVDMGKYTRNLVSDLRHSHMSEDGLIRLRLNLEDIPLGITEAIPCGLIINELVSNALKHAFPKGKEGEITIYLCRESTNQIALTVSDNGIGFPERIDFRKSPSLGLTLINSLVEQLNGTIQLDRKNGTTFTITFG
jgi:PAS domain S-box-containing protein